MFTETVQRRCDCLKNLIKGTSRHVPKDIPSKRTRSLWDMARRWLLQNIDDLGPESLAGTPLPILERIWPVNERRFLPLRLWKTMAQSQSALVFAHPHVLEYECRSCRRLPDILRIAECPTYAWLCDLTLDSDYVKQDDLFRVSNLLNIRRLLVRGSRHCRVTDRVLRSWADSASEHGAFSKLGLLMVDNESSSGAEGVTTASLERLQCFKALQQFCVSDRRRSPMDRTKVGRQYGAFRRIETGECSDWMYATDDMPSLQVTVGCRYAIRTCLDEYTDTACFRRAPPEASAQKRSNGVEPSAHHTTTKRRKPRNGRSVALSDLLGGM